MVYYNTAYHIIACSCIRLPVIQLLWAKNDLGSFVFLVCCVLFVTSVLFRLFVAYCLAVVAKNDLGSAAVLSSLSQVCGMDVSSLS